MHGRIPDAPSDWPSESRIAILLACASATETVTQTHRRLRRIMGLSDDVRITKRLLCERMTWEEYYELIVTYAARACAPGTGRMDADT